MPRVSRKIDKGQKEVSQKSCIAGYVRLSVEDIRKKESHSAENQKSLITNYVKTHFPEDDLVFYEDINETGMHFNRLAFQKLLEDAKSGKVQMVVVKDVSRLGRNFLETGGYIEEIFPNLHLRFISINDGYDSLYPKSQDIWILPIKNLMNELFVRDISRKIKAVYQLKMEKGEFCGSVAPYGFCVVDKRLVVDEDVIWVVKEIFALKAEGYGAYRIAKYLNAQGVLPPSRYKFTKGLVKSEKYENTCVWHKGTVDKILQNKVYGDVICVSECM